MPSTATTVPIVKAKAAIYSSDGSTLLGITEEKSMGTVDGWVMFNFDIVTHFVGIHAVCSHGLGIRFK